MFLPLGRSHLVALVDDTEEELVYGYSWYLTTKGYVAAKIPHPLGGLERNGTKGTRTRRYPLKLHRLICGLEFGDPREPDHINLNKLDNRRENLRIVSHAQNRQNVRSYQGSSSVFRGVSSVRGKWQVNGQVDGKPRYLGLYDDELEASAVASQWRLENMPFAVEGAQ